MYGIQSDAVRIAVKARYLRSVDIDLPPLSKLANAPSKIRANLSRLMARPQSGLVRIDQIFFAGRALGIDGDVRRLKRLLQGDDLRIVAGKGRLELGNDPLAKPQCIGHADLLKEWKQEPTADTPGHPERSIQLGRTKIKTAINIDLLVHVRSVAAVGFCGLVDRSLHAGENLTRELAAADGVERQRGPGLDQRVGKVVHEGPRGGVDHILRADLAQYLRLLRTADDVDQSNAVLEADLVEHLAEIGCGRRMHQRLVAFAPHGLDHPERGQRIDEA